MRQELRFQLYSCSTSCILWSSKEIDRDMLSSAQSALLFTYYVSARNANTNSYWLTIAIHYARVIQADQYYKFKQHGKANSQKRIWWACICRDRLLALGLRRPLQIGFHDFDFTQSVLTISDFSDEIHRSLVYSADSKRALIQLLSAQCELAVALTDGLTILSPLNATVYTKRERLPIIINELEQWHDKSRARLDLLSELGIGHESTVLYRNILSVYYHSAQLALHNYAIFLAMNCRARDEASQSSDLQDQVKHPVSDSIKGITECLVELGQRNLLRYLPITMVANITLPLTWYIIGTQISRMEVEKNMSNAALIIYTKVMRGLQAQYEGTDQVLDYIQKIIHLLRLEADPLGWETIGRSSKRRSSPQLAPTPCTETLAARSQEEDSVEIYGLAHCQPRDYVRITRTIDLSLAVGRFPESMDLPSPLQSLQPSIDVRLCRPVASSPPTHELLAPLWTTSPRPSWSDLEACSINLSFDDGDKRDRLAYTDRSSILDSRVVDDAAVVTQSASFDSHRAPESLNLFSSTSPSVDLTSLRALGLAGDSNYPEADDLWDECVFF